VTSRAIADISPVYCLPWHARAWNAEAVKGARCVRCDLDIAQPIAAAQRRAFCIYCGLDCGALPAVETPPY
jgi:hypothetical protein